MPLIADSSPMGTGGSPNLSAIIANIKAMILKGVNGNDLLDLFNSPQTISDDWSFSTLPIFGALNGVIKASTGTLTGFATINDLGSPTTAYSFGNQELRNLSKVIIGQNTTSDYNLFLKASAFTTLGTTKGSACISDSTYTANSFLGIDFNQANSGIPTGRVACYFTATGTFMYFFVSNNPASGTTAAPFGTGYFAEGLGIKIADSLFFTTNNIGSIGTSSVAVSNIYSVNSLNVTSDKRDKIVNEKLNLKKDFSFEFLEKMVKNCIISWKWNPTVIPEKKVKSFEKVIKKNEETGIDEIDYILTTKTIEPEKIIEHKRNHMGLNLNEFYKLMVEFNLSTKDYAFLSINDTYELKSFDSEGNEIIEIKNSFNELGDPILDPDGYPLGKMTYKPQELQSLLFIYSFELHKRDLEKNKKIDDLEKRLDDLEKQMKILLKK